MNEMEELLKHPSAKPSLAKMQEMLLKLAKQQREIDGLKTQLAMERQQIVELSERWEMTRTACDAPADDTVLEVLNRIKAHA
jgi:hypothetical protein